jgi:hypothetical protein
MFFYEMGQKILMDSLKLNEATAQRQLMSVQRYDSTTNAFIAAHVDVVLHELCHILILEASL